jgi:hypothetical protein
VHDRSVPGTKGNIDHIAVVASGVWIVDAKNYKGTMEQRDVGGLFKTDLRLYEGGRDRTSKAEGLGWQVLAVAKTLKDTDIPIRRSCSLRATGVSSPGRSSSPAPWSPRRRSWQPSSPPRALSRVSHRGCRWGTRRGTPGKAVENQGRCPIEPTGTHAELTTRPWSFADPRAETDHPHSG